ncbi:hypothetical protein JTE90_026456 [Oedothorax gibbosus]|uniref:Uncharacterized protein n=1 Tax=Oedothorax gibbosus TaxID=931172 RepID=A0AAV6VRZ5_9ARAC|nr:hypothetical protein JTE90_026456 [Oedothorax gibbosus]
MHIHPNTYKNAFNLTNRTTQSGSGSPIKRKSCGILQKAYPIESSFLKSRIHTLLRQLPKIDGFLWGNSFPFEAEARLRLIHCNSLKQYLKKGPRMAGSIRHRHLDLSQASTMQLSLSRMMAP